MSFYDELGKVPKKHDQIEKKLVDVSIAIESYLDTLIPLAEDRMTKHGEYHIGGITKHVQEAKNAVWQAFIAIRRAEELVDNVRDNLMEEAA